MATTSTPLGDLSGKIGNMRTSQWNGITVVAMQPSSYTDANTPVQQSNRSSFADLNKLGRQALAAIKVGFRQYKQGTSPYAQWVKDNSAALIRTNDTTKVLAPDALIFSKGNLPGVPDIKYNDADGPTTTVTWTNNSAEFGALPTDKLVLVLVDQDGRFAQVIFTGVARSAGTYTATVNPKIYNAGTYNIYGFMVSLVGGLHSDSESATQA